MIIIFNNFTMVGFTDMFKFGFTTATRKKNLKKKGYIGGTDGKIYRVTPSGINRVGVKKSWF